MIRNAVTALSPAVLRVMYFYLDVFTLKQIQYDDTVAAMGGVLNLVEGYLSP
jgi:hypothetical protein